MTQQLPGSGQIWTPPTSGVIPAPPVVGGPGGADWTSPQQAYLDALARQLAQSSQAGVLGQVFTGAAGMQDANFIFPNGFQRNYVGAQVQFSADRTLTLPQNPSAGTTVIWADEVTGSNALGVPHNLIVNTSDGKSIQGGVAGQTGGTNLAATYTATFAAWGAGASIELFFNGVFWKVI